MTGRQPFILHLSAIKSWGGGEQQLVYLFHELANQQLPQLLVCQTDSALASYCKQRNLPHVTYPSITGIDCHLAWRIAKLCKKHPINIIHAHDAHTQTAALLARWLFNITPRIIISRKVAFPIKKTWLARYKYNSPHIDKIICISNAVRNTLTDVISDPEKLVVIQDGIDLSRFDAHLPNPALHQILCPQETVLIGTAAALVGSKDLFTFIKVAKVLIDRGITAKFIIMGEGPLRQELQAFANELQLAEHIDFLGFRQDVAKLLPALDIFMLTSKQEGMGSSILEAMACNIPVVATRVGGIPEIVIDGETGLLAEAGDVEALAKAVLQLIHNDTLRQHVICNASQQLKKFSVQQMAALTLAVYQAVLGK